jgi:hypothetical protein
LAWAGQACSPQVNGLVDARIQWGWPMVAALQYIATIGPAIMAYRCWGLGMQRVRPALDFHQPHAALRRAAVSGLSGQLPHFYHGLALFDDRRRDLIVVAAL